MPPCEPSLLLILAGSIDCYIIVLYLIVNINFVFLCPDYLPQDDLSELYLFASKFQDSISLTHSVVEICHNFFSILQLRVV